jgi:hypothetical protein
MKRRKSKAFTWTVIIFLDRLIEIGLLLHGSSGNAIQTQAPKPHAPDHLPHLKDGPKTIVGLLFILCIQRGLRLMYVYTFLGF